MTGIPLDCRSYAVDGGERAARVVLARGFRTDSRVGREVGSGCFVGARGRERVARFCEKG